MAASITPVDQEILINPYSNKIFDFDNYSSRVYISRSVNNLLRSIGEDCVLDGLNPSAEYDQNTDLITITVPPGKAIIDTTLVEVVSSNNVLTFDVTSFVDTGYLIVTLSYRFINTLYSNLSKLRVFYVTNTGQDIIPDDYQSDYDIIVIAKFSFNKTEKTVTRIESGLQHPEMQTIRGNEFPVFPRNMLLINSFDEIRNLFAILNYN